MLDLKGKYVIVRGNRSGVFFGILEDFKGTQVELSSVRRLWRWDGANTCSDLAKDGVLKAKEYLCKFTPAVEELILTDAIEVILCTDKSVSSLKGVREWIL